MRAPKQNCVIIPLQHPKVLLQCTTEMTLFGIYRKELALSHTEGKYQVVFLFNS
jgi:hypothetical protein